ncbi:MAG: ADOP family duplicated permease [Longimicrobiales bacterium]
MDSVFFELRLALRGLVRNRALTLSAALALALGIGATTTLFSIVRGGLADLPFGQSEELVLITREHPERGVTNQGAQTFDYLTWLGALRGFEGISAFASRAMNLAGPEHAPERVSGVSISPNTFELLGTRPLMGRGFQAPDAVRGAPATVIIGHALWQARFAGAANIVGRPLRVDGTLHTIIGVMPEGFGFPINQSIWLPLQLTPSSAAGEGGWVTVFGRLRDDITIDQARAEVDGLATRQASEFPATHAGYRIRVAPLVEMEMEPGTDRILYIMLLAVSFVLVIACANVANLLLARAARRSRETAIRTVLGAARTRIIAQHLVEAMLIALLGGLGGLAIAYVGVRFFDVATAGILEAFWINFRVDRTVLAFATLLIAMAGILAGLVPALRASLVQPAGILKESTASGLHIGRLSRALVVAELALASGLLVVSGALVTSAIGLRAVGFPFAKDDIYTAQLGVRGTQLTDATNRSRFARDLTEKLASIPGVQAAALTSVLPGRGTGNTPFTVDGQPAGRPQDMLQTGQVLITPGFLDVLDARVVRGRTLTWSDDDSAPRVMLVDETWVRRFSSNRDPLGRTVTLWGDPPATIVGVISNVHMEDPGDPPAAGVYVPMLQLEPFSVRLMARSGGEVLALTPQVRALVNEVDPDLPMYEIATLSDAIYADAGVLDAFGTLFGIFGAGALFLTMVGLYGVVSFSVTQRTREIGIRMSLGATRRSILTLILRSGGRPLLWGGIIGLMIAVAISAALAATGEDVLRPDARIFVAVFVALAFTAVVALVIPARRAARLDPQRALRYD